MNNQRLIDLRNYMKKEKVDICILFSTDEHNSEYIGDFYKYRDYLTGFTGSYAVIIIDFKNAFLFTDGRYYLQAEIELQNSDFILIKQSEGVNISYNDYIKQNLDENMVLGIDARYTSADEGCILQAICTNNKALLNNQFYPSEYLWDNKPDRLCKPVFVLHEKYSGISAEKKLNILRENLLLANQSLYILSSLDDIAWLLNLRGNDICYNPVFYSYFVIDGDSNYLFCDINHFDNSTITYLKCINVSIKSYESLSNYLNKTFSYVLLDKTRTNYAIYCLAAQNSVINNKPDSIRLIKSIKNKVEIKNLKYCNILDGIVMVRFIIKIKQLVKDNYINEFDAGQLLDEMRKENDSCFGPSFETICAYQENAAVIHYCADKNTALQLINKGILLVDSGGQYLYGTTDVTRTFSLGEIDESFKHDFTLVLKGFLRLQNCVFKEGTNGQKLDIIAREPLWSEGKDYKHGTGHGIGFFLNVHEDPVRINTGSSCIFKEGMIVSNEPGLYLKNKYGIRTENMLLCVKKFENNTGSYLGFEPLTYVPIDETCIDFSILSQNELEALHSYQKLVYKTLSPHLNSTERKWLQNMTNVS